MVDRGLLPDFTAASSKGTWVHLLSIPVDVKLVEGVNNIDVDHPVRVELISVDVDCGFIDFKRVR